VIAVASGKGGSGKTTTTLGLARALSRRGGRAVAVDADWDLPNLARLASRTADADRPAPNTVREALEGRASAPSDEAEPTVLAAPNDHSETDPVATFTSLADAVPDEAPTLLDCPAGASPDAAAPLRAADRSLLVTPLRRAALRDAAKTAAIARRLECPPLGVVAVRADTAPAPVADLLGCPVLGCVPAATPTPLADGAVNAAYDDIARRLSHEYGSDAWCVA